jgi:hypothetical protein
VVGDLDVAQLGVVVPRYKEATYGVAIDSWTDTLFNATTVVLAKIIEPLLLFSHQGYLNEFHDALTPCQVKL